MDEYKQIQELRRLWSQTIMDWLKLIVPIGTAISGFFSYIGYLEKSGGLALLGWGIFATALITWRVVVCHIDKQIVGMYPRMLELEKDLGWATHARYYYHNLSKDAKRYLEKSLELGTTKLSELNYRKYEKKALEKKKDPYSLFTVIRCVG